MTTTVDTEWPALARRLADDLERTGKLSSPAWRAAVCEVPRHELVPEYFLQDPTGTWVRSNRSSEAGRQQWLEKIYSNSVLITALRQDVEPPRVLSSSTQPGLMTRMLEALDVQDGHRVLEIGTGTGYNAALMSHRLGSDKVFSVDVEPDLIEMARERLGRRGFTPTLVSDDGVAGLPGHAPFDRIIATCAVSALPWSWVDQVGIGGVVLTDLKIAHGAGSLVRVARCGSERAEGRFDATYAAFMGRRQLPGEPDRDTTWTARATTDVERRVTTADPQTPWNSMIVWFLAAFELGPDISIGFSGTDTTRPPTAVSIATPDGSWARIALDVVGEGHEVTEGGPRRLWRAVETAHCRWDHLGRPGWDRFGLTVTPAGQIVWLDDPGGSNQWPITV